jgi:hypothetical protein
MAVLDFFENLEGETFGCGAKTAVFARSFIA